MTRLFFRLWTVGQQRREGKGREGATASRADMAEKGVHPTGGGELG